MSFQSQVMNLPIKKILVLLDHGLTSDSVTGVVDYNLEYDKACLHYFKDTFEPLVNNDIVIDYLNDHQKLFVYLQNEKPDFIINLVNYGYLGNERSEYFSSVFEMLNIPFSNAGMLGMSLANDKFTLHKLALTAEVPTPKQMLLTSNEILRNPSLYQYFDFPAFLKLRFGKGSCGITELNSLKSPKELNENFQRINEIYSTQSELGHHQWLLQEYLPGPEYNVGVIGNGDDLTVLPIVEDQLSEDNFKTYEDKKLEKEHLKGDTISYEAEKIIIDSAKKIFKITECRDYCRMDFRCDKNGIPMIMDVNPSANYGPKEAFAYSATLAGWSPQMLRKELFLISLKRHNLIAA